jgi:CheY-like chemotaxis protein
MQDLPSDQGARTCRRSNEKRPPFYQEKMGRCNFSLSGIKILVVDDEPLAREAMQELLSFYEVRVLTALDGTDGLDQVQKHKPDIIVSDIIMPRMDGYHFIREVRGLGPHDGGETPAVALTALNRLKDRTRAVAAGFQYHLVKPFDIMSWSTSSYV